jgi:O-antigen/teichoic acid export membrane protein
MLRCMAVMPLVSALATAPNAYSRRAMQFKPLAVRVLISVLLSGILGLVLTLFGFGVWALVWQAIVQRLLNVGVLWRLVPIKFQVRFSRPHFNELWRYAGPMLLSQSMAWSGSQIPRFILGLFLGAAELGLFSLASRIHEILLVLTLSPSFAVARVTMREHSPHSAGLNDAIAQLLARMAMLCFPVAVGGAAVMPVLFLVWLDARWAGGVHVAQFMLLGAMPFATHYALSAALLGMNKQASVAVNSTVQTISIVVVTALFAPLGLNPAAAAIAFRPLVTAPIPMYFARKQCGVPTGLVLRAQLPLFAAAILMGAGVWLIETLLAPVLKPGEVLLAAITSGAILYPLFCLWLAPRSAVAPFADRFKRVFGF